MALTRNILANYLGQALRAVLGIALVPIYIEYVGLESYGLIGIFGVLQAWLALLDFGLKPALSREMARFTGGAHTAAWIRDLLRTVEVIAGSISLAVAAGLFVASPWLAENWVNSKTLSPDVVTLSLRVMALVTALRFVENIYTSSLVGLQQQVRENGISSVAAVVRGFGAIALLHYVSPTVTAFFAWQAVVSVLTVASLAAAVYGTLPRSERPARFSPAALTGVKAFASGVLLITLESLLLTNLDKLVLSKVLPLEELGKYILAGVAANTLGMLTQPIASALTPRLTELVTSGEHDQLRDTYYFGSQAVATLAGSAAIVLAVFAQRVMILWTKKPDLGEAVAPIVVLLVVGSLCNALMYVPFQLQMAHGSTRLIVVYNAALVVVIVPLLLILAPQFGGIAAAGLWAGLNASYLLLVIPIVHRRFVGPGLWRWYWQATFRPVLVALTVCLVLHEVVPKSTNRLIEFLALFLVSALTLTAAALSSEALRARLITCLIPRSS